MAKKQYKITQLQQDSTLLELHPETDADIVNVETGTGKYQGTATNVQDALEEIYEMAETGGVTGVKGDAETDYRTGNVNLTPANIGAEAAFVDGSATIATESNGVVTIKAGVAQTDGAIANDNNTDIVLGTAAKKTATTTVDSNSTDAQVPTAKAVFDAIDAMPEPMIFKGSLGTGGTITDLPAASTANEGYTYKVITAGTYASQAAKIGDTFISDGTNWVLIPSGDEPSGTVTSVGVDTASGSHLSTSGTPVTSSGTITISVDSGYSIPSDTDQTAWNAKYDLPSTGMPKTDLAQGVQDSLDLADSAYQLPATGMPKADLAQGVQDSLDLADSAYQKPAAGIPSADLAVSGVTAGSYSAVTVNNKGIVTAGGQILEVGATGQSAPSANLAVGGIFFQEI